MYWIVTYSPKGTHSSELLCRMPADPGMTPRYKFLPMSDKQNRVNCARFESRDDAETIGNYWAIQQGLRPERVNCFFRTT